MHAGLGRRTAHVDESTTHEEVVMYLAILVICIVLYSGCEVTS